MKRIQNNITIVSLSFFVVSLFLFSGVNKNNTEQALGAAPSVGSLPTSLNLNDNTEAQVRSYYSSLNSLGTSERQGTNLLKNLKPILYNDMKYFSYANVWNTAKITERDWTRSPASSMEAGTYNSSTGMVTGYSASSDDAYLHVLYRNDNGSHNMKMSSSHSDTYNALNREHIWPQSRGFKDDSGASGPAGTDIHHLQISDARVNQVHHNNYAYGNVTTISTQESGNGIDDNKRGTNTSSGGIQVFEPQDSDKGNIARACLYMVARYNNYAGASGVISDFEPNLILNDDYDTGGSAVASSDSTPASYASLSTLLAWHELDPVDEYELHRNNLIYRNFQYNRNPFIDFPEWVNCIWNNSSGLYATPSTDSCTSGASISVTGVTLNKSSTSIAVGDTEQLTATVAPSNASNQSVSWSTNNSSVATVSSSGLVSGVSTGNATITATTSDGGFTATCSVIITAASFTPTTTYEVPGTSPNTAVLVTDVSTLAANQEVIIAAKTYTMALGASAGNYRTNTSVTFTDNDISDTGSATVLTLGVSSGSWTFTDNGSYLCSPENTSKNYLTTEATLSDRAKWTISISSGTATITSVNTSTRLIQYNSNSDQTRFSTYTGTQKSVEIYRYNPPTYEYNYNYLTDVLDGDYCTMDLTNLNLIYTRYNAMTSTEIEYFNDSIITGADSNSYTGLEAYSQAMLRRANLLTEENQNTNSDFVLSQNLPALIAVILCTSLITITSFFVLKKKHY